MEILWSIQILVKCNFMTAMLLWTANFYTTKHMKFTPMNIMVLDNASLDPHAYLPIFYGFIIVLHDL